MMLSGKRIVVTGAASGIGAATVRAYSSEGAAVLGLDVDDERGGSVVEEAANYASMAGVAGSIWSPGYAAAKGGVLAWTRSVARSWGKHSVRANAVCPLISTPMSDSLQSFDPPERHGEAPAQLKNAIPLGGALGDADTDMAPVMVFLASDMSRFITGQTLPVDGGALVLS